MSRYIRWYYVGWLGIISGLIALQFYLAGYGVFGGSIGAHTVVGWLIGLALLIGVALALAVRAPGRLTFINAGLIVLMLFQSILAHTGVPGISALHVVNGVLIFVTMLYLVRQAWKWAALPAASQPRAVPSPAPFKT